MNQKLHSSPGAVCLLWSAVWCLLVSSASGMFTDLQGKEIVSEFDLEKFKTARLLNELEVAASVQFVNHTRNPYPPGNQPYNVEIDRSMNCYIVFKDAEKDSYDLISSDHEPESEFPVHLTHQGPCGVCSTLQDLGVYLRKRDLTTPVRRCAMIPVPGAKRQCLRNVGFSEKCVWIWFWNAHRTAQRNSKGGCRRTCIRHLNTPNNQQYGTYNPCKPMKMNEEYGMYEDDYEASGFSSYASLPNVGNGRRTGLFPSMRKKISQIGSERKRREERGHCKNTINKEPVCHPDQYTPGKYRLNACLQCDECKAGPVFQKVSGRVRRNSGIRSAIDRPGVPTIYHHYFSGIKDEL